MLKLERFSKSACCFMRTTCFGILSIFLTAGCCQNTIDYQTVSPDGKHTAVVFTRDCGATTAYSSQITVVRGGKVTSVSGLGNIFIGDQDDQIKIVWDSSKALTVQVSPYCRISKSEKSYD